MSNQLQEYPLKDFVISQKGSKPSVLSKRAFKDSLSYLDINALENGIINYYTHKELAEVSTDNDILVVWDGSRSGLTFKGQLGAVGSTLMRLTPIGLNQEYLYQFLKSKFSYINENSTGTGIPHVNSELFFNIKIPIISIEEQNIVINELNKKLDFNKNILEKQNKIVRQILNNTELDFQDNENIEKSIQNFRQTALDKAIKGNLTKVYREQKGDNSSQIKNGLIENWKTITISEVSKVIDPDPSHRSPKEVEGGIPYIGIGDITASGKINLENARKVGQDVLDSQQQRFYIDNNDIIFGRVGTIGNPILVNEDDKFALSSNVMLIKPDHAIINPKYFYYLLISDYAINLIDQQTNNSSQPLLTINKFRSIKLTIPPLEEQKEIVKKIEQLFIISERVQDQYREAKNDFDNLEKSILDEVFSIESSKYNNNISEILNSIKQEKAYLENKLKISRKEQLKKRQKLTKTFVEASKLDIEDILISENRPLPAKELWESSVYQDNIDAFYNALSNKISKNILEWKIIDSDKETPVSIVKLKQ